jgi:hypothetical protein
MNRQRLAAWIGATYSSAMTESPTSLEAEARLFARYLLGRDPPEEMTERYVRANGILFLDSGDARDRRLLDLVRRRPALLGCLDAAAGLLAPNSLLRKKLLLMAAILEVSPLFAEEFLPRTLSIPRLLATLAGNAVTAGLKLVLGVPLYFLVMRGVKEEKEDSRV